MGLLQRFSRAARILLGYDAVRDTPRRRLVNMPPRAEHDVLTEQDRRKLMVQGRDLHRNFAAARWAISKHLDFVASYRFQGISPDQETNRRMEEFVREWSKPQNLDYSGRFDLWGLLRLVELRRVVDGDVFLLKLRDGRVQLIEADRVVSPTTGQVRDLPGTRWIQGVRVDERTGRPLAYAIHRRDKYGRLVLERIVSARNVIHVGYFDRYDQVRGISPLAAALNTYRDLYELFDFAVVKAKVLQFFGLAMKTDDADSAVPIDSADDTSVEPPFFSSLPSGTVVMNLRPDEDLDVVESKTPPAELLDFGKLLLSIALKALDIPYSFFDEAYTNFSGARQALVLYNKSARRKQRELIQQCLEPLLRWRLGLAVYEGELNLDFEQAKFTWVPDGLPWIDPLKEINADILAIQAGLRTRKEIRRERYGDEWDEVVLPQLKAEEDALQANDLMTAPNLRPVPVGSEN